MSDTALLHDYLANTAAKLPAKCAIVCNDRRVTYGELNDQADQLARFLLRNGAGRGERVVICGENGIEVGIAFWAALKAGAAACILPHQARAERLARVLMKCRPGALIADGNLGATVADAVSLASAAPWDLRATILYGPFEPERFPAPPAPIHWDGALGSADADAATRLPRVATALPRASENDLAAIIFTSGSTGEPKGVMMAHRNMTATAVSVGSYLEIREDDVILNLLPFSFSYGLYQMIMAFRAGARVVLARSIAYPGDVVRLLEAEGATMFPGVPAFFAILGGSRLARERDLSKVRCVTNAAAALPVKRIPEIRATFPRARIFSMYGQTECKRVSYLPPEDLDRKPDSIGIPIPGSEFWVVDDDGERLPPGEAGELVVRGPHVMLGYWEDPAESAKRLRPGPRPGESVLFTGDLCRMDEEGYLYFVSRKDEVLKLGGEKVAPLEVELAIQAVPGVREAAVIGVPDEIMGHAIHAFVTLEDGVTLRPGDIQRQCQARLEHFKVPKVIQIVTEMPRTTTGKVARPALRALVEAAVEGQKGSG